MTIEYGVHGKKLVALLDNRKLPADDLPRVRDAIDHYETWIEKMEGCTDSDSSALIEKLVALLNEYKLYLDVDVIFDSPNDFLYRQKGQVKIDNTVVEEFLPILVRKCLCCEYGSCTYHIDSQTKVFSSAFFGSSLARPGVAGALSTREKDQDFSIARCVHLRSSYSPSFPPRETEELTTYLGYVVAEIKTNLDKTMFQEASATAHDTKLAVSGAKYFLLCDFLDMTPISTSVTDIEEVLIMRKAKRMSSTMRAPFGSYAGRVAHRDEYVKFLTDNPYSTSVFERFVGHIISQIAEESLVEQDVLDIGYF